MPRWIASALVGVMFLAAGSALDRGARADDDQVDLLLVLAADVSRSVDAAKFKLQREGYAAAITHPKVVAAIESVPTGRIAICFVEWSGATAQAVMVDWTLIGNAAEAQAFADGVLMAPRLFMERTSISAAIDFALAQIERAPFKGSRHIIDVSGDGTNNSGRDVVQARDEALARGVTINGVAILSTDPLPSNPLHTHPPGGLLKYYEDNVIGGPGAFALAAETHADFGRSMISKLVKEIALAPGVE
ncbi:MAG TPA: DUF1194 domain-containing protein [Hyphomicrobiaceae bacterium]|nr:DUF1194 domain-containing protein [Hyphomicrobiaceae bacterium]